MFARGSCHGVRRRVALSRSRPHHLAQSFHMILSEISREFPGVHANEEMPVNSLQLFNGS